MKATIKVEREVDIKELRVNAGVRYWEDATVDGVGDEAGDLIPCRTGGSWCPIIDVDTGRITNWNKDVKADIHYKVCDCFSCELIDANGEIVFSQNNEYVPNTMCPGGIGYGDYIIMNVSKDGVIENWRFDVDDFISED